LVIFVTVTDRVRSSAYRRTKARTFARSWRFRASPPRAVAATLAGTLAIHAVLSIVSNAPFFDRYLLGPSAWAAGLLISGGVSRSEFGRTTLVAAALGSLVFTLVSARLVGAAAALDGGTWRIAEQLGDDVDRRSIDAGFAWFGYHQTGPIHSKPVSGRNWWTSFYPDQPICVTVLARSGDGHGPAFGLLGPEYDFDAVWSDDPECVGMQP
jgi:hypothetical protein